MRRLAAAAGCALLLLGSGCSKKERPAPIAAQEEADQTRPADQWLAEEPVRMLQEYVRIDTSPGKGEQAGAEYLHRLLECAGISSEIVCPAPGRCNVLARLEGRRQDGALLLLNHIDVVGAYPELWKEAAPFSGAIKGGYLYGRGAYDMKSLGLIEALALRDLKSHAIVPERDILFLGEADEESDQKWGSRWLLDHRPEWFRGVAAVFNEGAVNEMILRTVRFWGIETVAAGYGVAVFDSPSARSLAELSAMFPKFDAPPVIPNPQVVLGFDMLANHLGHPLTDPLRHLDRVARDRRELAALPDRYASFLEPRIYWPNPYPYPPGQTATYRTFAIISTPPGISPDPLLVPLVKEAGRRGIHLVQTQSSGPTSASPYPTELTELLKLVIQARFPGAPVGPVPTSGGESTSNIFRNRGIPAYGFSTIPINSFDAARRHGNDERIYLRDYLIGLDLYREVLAEFAFQK